MTHHWRNWSGLLTSTPKQHIEPRTLDEISNHLRTAEGPVRLVGSGHSFTPLCQCNGTSISLRNFTGLVSHDSARHTASIRAGTGIGALAKALQDVGQALPNMGDIDVQAFAGALATGTHGSGKTLGAYHTLLEAMEIVDMRGQIHHVDAAQSPDMLAALGCSLGAFGAVTQVTLRNMPAYRLRRRRFKVPLEAVLADFDAMMGSARSAEFFAIPAWDHVAFLTSDLSDAPTTERPPDEDDDAVASLKLLRDLLQWFPWARRNILSLALKRFPEEDYVEDWLKVYPSERKTRFNEMEYHLPLEYGAQAVREIMALVNTRFSDIYFPVEVRVVAPDNVWLSPFYQRPTCSIAVHHGAGEDPMPYFNACEAVFRRYHGRPHWGKMHTLKAADLAALYPKWREAMALRREFDPDNRLVTPYMAGLLDG